MATTVASGTGVEDLPIDINIYKLTEWLISRNWIKAEFSKSISAVRSRITEAMKDMPDSPELAKILSRAYINYYHCKRIVDLLKVSEADTKNVFGMYGSKRMKDWVEIVKAYEKDNLFLGECANMLIFNVKYEVPTLKKTVERAQKKILDLNKKEQECQSNISAANARFAQTCKEMGIAGQDIPKELSALVSTLPEVFKAIAAKAQDTHVAQALDYYKAFLVFTLDEKKIGSVVPLLAFVHANGNTSVHKWSTGEDLPDEQAVANATEYNLDIDWGNLNTEETPIDYGEAPTIDFGDVPTIDFGDAPAIDFGDAPTIDFGDAPTIDFGDAPTIDFGEAPEIVVESSSAAIVKTRESILEHTDTRNQFLDEILELEGFLMQRKQEVSGATDMTSINQFQGAPSIIQNQSAKSVGAMLDAVRAVKGMLTDSKTQQLVMMKASPRYVQRLADSLRAARDVGNKMKSTITEVDAQRSEAHALIKETQPKLVAVVQSIKELQAQVEKSISGLYNNRRVNIQGEINSL